MRDLGGGIPQLCGLEVEDIGSRRLDRIHFRVFEVEHGAIEFLCDSFTCYDELR